MTQLWKIVPDIKPRKLIIHQYKWDKNGFVLIFYDPADGRQIEISFPVELDGVRISFLQIELEAEDRVYFLLKEAGLTEGDCPICPAFITDQSDFIDYVKQMAGYAADELNYLQYIIMTDDFWIEVVSSTPPVVQVVSK